MGEQSNAYRILLRYDLGTQIVMASDAMGDETIFREVLVLLDIIDTQAATDIQNTSSHGVKGCGRHIERAECVGTSRQLSDLMSCQKHGSKHCKSICA